MKGVNLVKYKDAFIPSYVTEEIVEILNLAYLISVNERLFGEFNIDRKSFEDRIIRVQNLLLKKIADY